jgi:hypothetical protein
MKSYKRNKEKEERERVGGGGQREGERERESMQALQYDGCCVPVGATITVLP